MSTTQSSRRGLRTESSQHVGAVVFSVVVGTVIALAIMGMVAFAAIKTSAGTSGPVDLTVSAAGGSNALKLADSTALRQQLNGTAAVTPIVWGTETVSVGDQSQSVRVVGVTAEFTRMLTWQMDQGRFLSPDDEAALERVAVVDRRLFGPGDAAVGTSLSIRDIPFTIVGVGANTEGQAEVLIPFRTGQIRLFGPTALDQIELQVGSSTEAASLSRQVEGVLRSRHGLRTGQLDDFSISTARPTTIADASPTADRVVTVVQQFWCLQKNICVSHGR
jgi:MacB-like protein